MDSHLDYLESKIKNKATLSTVFGVGSLVAGDVFTGLILAIVGIICGVKERKETGEVLGLILSIIGAVRLGLTLLLIVGYFILYFVIMFLALGGY